LLHLLQRVANVLQHVAVEDSEKLVHQMSQLMPSYADNEAVPQTGKLFTYYFFLVKLHLFCGAVYCLLDVLRFSD